MEADSVHVYEAGAHTRTHPCTHMYAYAHVYGERAVFFRREARLSLSHSISSWSYIRGQRERTDIPARRRCQDQKSGWLLYAAGEKDRDEEKRNSEQGGNQARSRKEAAVVSFPPNNYWWNSPKTFFQLFKTPPDLELCLLPFFSMCTCKATCIYCSQGYCCRSDLLLSCCQAVGKPCTMLPTSCALFQLLKGTGPDGVWARMCVSVCVCVSPGLYFGSRLLQNWHKPNWVIHAVSLFSVSHPLPPPPLPPPPQQECICEGLCLGNVCICLCLSVL